MPSFVPTSADTLEEQRLYTQARLAEVACLDCLATVAVKKNSDHHTSIQWSAEAVTACPVLGRRDGDPAVGTVTGGAPVCWLALMRPYRMVRSPSAPKTATEQRHSVASDRLPVNGERTAFVDIESFLLNVVDVVEETADARSISFEVPADAPRSSSTSPASS